MVDKPTSVELRDEQAAEMFDSENDSVLQLDPETLDPEFRYRFAFNSPNRLARLRAKGYDFVTEDDGVLLKDPLVGIKSPEGYILVGDSVLMRCPKRRYDRRRERIKSVTEDRLGEGAGGDVKAAVAEAARLTQTTSKIITS